jgi:hypothetical protein
VVTGAAVAVAKVYKVFKDPRELPGQALRDTPEAEVLKAFKELPEQELRDIPEVKEFKVFKV